MPFTREELRAMARLSPARRRAICREVYGEASRTAYVTAQDNLGLEDAGMGKSLGKRLKKAVQKVVAPVKRVVDKVQDTASRVIGKAEDAAKRIAENTSERIKSASENVQEQVREVASKIPGAKSISNIGREIQEQAKRAGSAVQRVAKEAARKAAPILPIVMPLSLGVKSIRTRAAKFYRKNGPLIVTAAGAVLAPFTYGLSALAATMLVKGRELYLARNAAIKAKEEAKAEAGQMAAAVQEQEAALHAQCDEVYNHPDSHDAFLAIGLTPERWAALSVDAKMGIIDSLSKGEMPAGYSLTPEAQAAADEVRRKAQNDELDDLYVKYQATFEAAGYPPDQWYAMTLEQKYATLDRLTADASGGSEGAPPPVTTGGTAPSGSSTPPTSSTQTWQDVVSSQLPGATIPTPPSQPLTMFSVTVEGTPVGVFSSLSEATEKALNASAPGDRVQIYQKGKGTTLGIRTAGGIVPVPEDQVAAVQAMSHGEVVSKVAQATATAGGAKTSGGFPWWLVAVPAVLFVGAKAKGA